MVTIDFTKLEQWEGSDPTYFNYEYNKLAEEFFNSISFETLTEPDLTKIIKHRQSHYKNKFYDTNLLEYYHYLNDENVKKLILKYEEYNLLDNEKNLKILIDIIDGYVNENILQFILDISEKNNILDKVLLFGNIFETDPKRNKNVYKSSSVLSSSIRSKNKLKLILNYYATHCENNIDYLYDIIGIYPDLFGIESNFYNLTEDPEIKTIILDILFKSKFKHEIIDKLLEYNKYYIRPRLSEEIIEQLNNIKNDIKITNYNVKSANE